MCMHACVCVCVRACACVCVCVCVLVSVHLIILMCMLTQVHSYFQVNNNFGNDFVGDNQIATFTPSSSVAFVTFTVADDDEPENEELFSLRLVIDVLPYNGLTLGTPDTVSVTVAANDDAYGVFGFLEVSWR